MLKLAVGVLTFKREDQLERCLRSIACADIPAFSQVDVIIGDNDPDSDSRKTYIPNGVRYKLGEGSVAAGRQSILDIARRQNADYLAFIDDDEIVTTEWLDSLVRTALEYKAAAVAGPVYPAGLSGRQEVLHRRAERATGAIVMSAGGGNLLLDLERTAKVHFDVSWPFWGGEDTDFTMWVSKACGEIVWCNEAKVLEPTESARRTASWLLRRHFLNGRILAHAMRKHGSLPSPLERVYRGFSALVLVGTLPLSYVSARWFRLVLDKGIRQLGFMLELSFYSRRSRFIRSDEGKPS